MTALPSSSKTQVQPFRCTDTSPEVIRMAVMLHERLPPSLRNVEDLLHERMARYG